jgi:hypothetical protein
MRIDLGKLVNILPGQSGQRMRDSHFIFTNYQRMPHTQQFVILQQGTGNSVFNSHYAKQRRIKA